MSVNEAREAVTDHLPDFHAPAANSDEHRRDLRLDACRGLALWFISSIIFPITLSAG
jgi:hypothetical protein